MKWFICIALLASSLFAADIKTIAIPQNAKSATYSKVLDALRDDGVEFNLLEVDFKKEPQEINKIISSSADILFVTGVHLEFTINNLDPKGVNIVFVGVKDVQDLGELKERSAGVFRHDNMGELLSLNYNILSNNEKMAILYESGSKIETLVHSFIKKAKKYKANVYEKSYGSANEFDDIFREFKKDGFTSVLIFSPSVSNDEFPLLIEAQNRYKLPVLAQRLDQIEKGATAGTVANYELIVPLVKLKIEKLLEGLPISLLKNDIVEPKYAINLKSVADLNVQIDKKIVEKALVVF